MSYLDRLRAEISGKCLLSEPTKLTEGAFVSSVSTPSRPLSENSATERRRQRVLAILDARPDTRYAVLTDAEADPEAVILALAIRGAMADGSTVTCELRVPREKYDPFLLIDLIARHADTVQ